ncbi:MAG: hypothetical protein KC427_08525 [Sulfurovum sp.]|uniref:hypothetical protein n=1 Tax=Sulfurovum sp. TaxID=1969726 RepID=UPI002867EB19|nr:hypothetical protein [Sulfurovum sp.]MCO4846046.1 hypothetical protein [Sulfurovum sp.]
MKYIIDLIEDVREEIGNQEDFVLTAMLLKENPEDSEKLTYAGEAPLNLFHLDEAGKQLNFKIDGSPSRITVGELIPPLLILDMDAMMYELRMDVNTQYSDMEIVGFGKNDEEKKYIFFIKI